MITMIVGTNRPGANSRKVARNIEEIYSKLGVALRVLKGSKLFGFSP